MSAGIAALVRLARQTGMTSSDGAWSEAYVYWFDRPMPDGVRRAGTANPALDYHSAARTPHTPAHEGFLDRDRKVAITFETDVQ